MDNMNKEKMESRRSLSWPRLREVENGVDLPVSNLRQMHLQMLRSRQNLDLRNDAMGTNRASESNDAGFHLNANISAAFPATRYSSLFESSNPFLPERSSEATFRSISSYQSRGQPRRRSSSPASISQRSLCLADLLQEAIDVSSTVVFPNALSQQAIDVPNTNVLSNDGEQDDDVADSFDECDQ